MRLDVRVGDHLQVTGEAGAADDGLRRDVDVARAAVEEHRVVAAARGVPAQLSLEAIMGCGFGACWGCVHRIKNETGDGWVKICEEGPVFPGERILWP